MKRSLYLAVRLIFVLSACTAGSKKTVPSTPVTPFDYDATRPFDTQKEELSMLIRYPGKKWHLLLILFILAFSMGCSHSPAISASPSIGQSPTNAVLIAGQTRVDGKGVEQVWVPSGSFRMGTDDATIQALQALQPSAPGFVLGEFPTEQPQHEVHLTRGYWIDKVEVTNASYQAFVQAGGYTDRSYWSEAGWEWLGQQNVGQLPKFCLGNIPENPVACVSWYEAEAYAKWRGERLPSEAEWEYAARGPESLTYPWGNEFDASWCNLVDSKGLQPVGSYPTGASWVGALDMAGNVMEWVQDWLGPYASGSVTDPTGPVSGKVKVEKGGWWGGTMFVA